MPDKEPWEHHVTDVSENFDYINLKMDPEEKLHIHKIKEIPTVIIFGWAGASDKYLKPYSKLYEERGVRSIRYNVPVRYLFFRSNDMPRIGEEMVEVFERQKFKDRPLIFHIFSNGGAYQYEAFMKALNKTDNQNQVKGMIFDSCPSKRKPLNLYLAIRANVDSKYFKIPISVLLTIYANLKRSMEMYYARMMGKECIQMNPYRNLMDEENRCPQLFIYSTLDKVVPIQYVESFVNHRKALGVDVEMKRYENSHHVQHYMKNKASYTRSVFKFLNKVLR